MLFTLDGTQRSASCQGNLTSW